MSNHWFPNGAGVSVDTMDGHFDLTKVVWQQVAPCGCVNGLMTAATPENLIITADQAMRKFAATDKEYERDVEQGFTCRPREWHKGCDEAKTKCAHDPEWGIEPTPKPEGYVWATVYSYGSHSPYTHLVPVAAVEASEAREYNRDRARPLCKGKEQFSWSREQHATMGKVECKKCIAAAEKALAGAA